MKITICILLIVKSLCDVKEAISSISKTNITDAPTMIMNAIEFYLDKVKQSGEDILGNDTEFFNEMNTIITKYKEEIDLKNKIEILKTTMKKLKEKFQTIDPISTIAIFPLWEKMIEQYEQFVIKDKEEEERKDEVIEQTEKQIEFNVKIVNTSKIDRSMLILVIVIITFLTMIGLYIITRKKIKKNIIQPKVNKHSYEKLKMKEEIVPLKEKEDKVIKIHIKQINRKKIINN